MEERQEQELEQQPKLETREDKRIKALEAVKNTEVIFDDLNKNKAMYQPGALAWRCLDLLKVLIFVLLQMLEYPEAEEKGEEEFLNDDIRTDHARTLEPTVHIIQRKLEEKERLKEAKKQGNEGKGSERVKEVSDISDGSERVMEHGPFDKEEFLKENDEVQEEVGLEALKEEDDLNEYDEEESYEDEEETFEEEEE